MDTEKAFDAARLLATLEGFFVGTSTGAALEAATGIGRQATERGEAAVIVAIAPDNGSKYLSTGLWGTA